MTKIEIISVRNLPILTKFSNNNSLTTIIGDLIKADQFPQIEQGDIIAISHTFLAKIYGHLVEIDTVIPSKTALDLAEITQKSSKYIQLVLNQTKSIIRVGGPLITENKAGIIGASSGIDKSNIPGSKSFAVIPENPNDIAKNIQNEFSNLLNITPAIIITDSIGRPFRKGAMGVAIGSAGCPALINPRGKSDLYDYTLENSEVAFIDPIAAIADVVMGQAAEGIPMVILRGFLDNNPKFDSISENASQIQRSPDQDLFRLKDWEQVMKFRRSNKNSYLNKPIPADILQRAIEFGTMAPNAHNSQCWRFINIQNESLRMNLINSMGNKWKQDMELDGLSKVDIAKKLLISEETFLKAPLLLLICYDESDLIRYKDLERFSNERILGQQSTASATIQIMLAFEGFGINSCWYSAALFAKEAVKTSLNLPNSWHPQILITAGYALEPRFKTANRRPLSEVFFSGKDFIN
jgi:coenzyme F420-0:L-glutamate ligase